MAPLTDFRGSQEPARAQREGNEMKMQSVLFAAAALGASAFTVTVAASPAAAASINEVVVTAQASDLPTAQVRYDDINLASKAGRARLEGRVDFAARMLCGKRDYQPLTINAQIDACQDAVHASAKPQVKALYAAIEGGQRIALGDTGALTLSAK